MAQPRRESKANGRREAGRAHYRDLSGPARYSRIPADEDHFGTPLWAEVQLETDLPSYARAWTAVYMQEEKAAVSEEDPGGIRRGEYFEQGLFFWAAKRKMGELHPIC